MPIYEYQAVDKGCAKCTSPFEVFQKASDPHLKTCPECQAAVQRLVSRPAINSTRWGGSYADARAKGFQVLKRRDKGAYEILK